MRFPRLESLFGVPLRKVNEAALRRLVEQNTPESGDLDWKRELYKPDGDGRAELAKDVAALANSTGGLLVLGVAETSGKAADELTPVPLSESERRRMRDVLTERIRPFLPGVDIWPIPTEQDPDQGFYMILVPRSAEAPHAVTRGSALGYPVRNDVVTRWLTEGEVAVHYRERFVARTQLGEQLETIFKEGCSRLNMQHSAWLSMSAIPTLSGNRPSGSAGIARAQGFFITWARRAAPLVSSLGNLGAVPGVRRAILTATGSYAGTSDDVHLELHHDGGGFAALTVGACAKSADGEVPPPVAVHRDDLEIYAMSLASLLADHAADTGASGELMLLAQLHTPVNYMSGPGRWPTEIHAAIPVGQLRKPLGTLTLTNTRIVATTVLLEETAGSVGGAIRGAYPLVADILAEFGIAEPAVLQANGTFHLGRIDPNYRNYLRAWAEQNSES